MRKSQKISKQILFFQRLENVGERKGSVKEEQASSDMSQIIEKLKSQRRPSNSSSVSQTSTTGAIESTSGVNIPLDPEAPCGEAPEIPTRNEIPPEIPTREIPKDAEPVTIPVAFGSDNENDDNHKSSMNFFSTLNFFRELFFERILYFKV